MSLLAIGAEKPLVIHRETFSVQQDEQASIAKPSALPGQRQQPFTQARIVRPTKTVPNRHPVAPDHSARPPFAHLLGAHSRPLSLRWAIEDKQGWALQQIADRLEGKPVQVVDATVDDHRTVHQFSDAELSAILRRRLVAPIESDEDCPGSATLN
jgi:hypothetical protein